MIRYNELLRRKLSELKLEAHTFFRVAHCAKFGTTPDLSEDVLLYQTKGTIPVYVINYLKEIYGGAISLQAVQSGDEDQRKAD